MSPTLFRSLFGPRGGEPGYVPATPSNVGGGTLLWWDANTLALANNDPVASWTDKSRGVVAAQSSPAIRPIFKTGAINGYPAVEFASASSQFLQFAPAEIVTDLTAFAVFRTDAAGSSTINPIFGGVDGTPGRRISLVGKTLSSQVLKMGFVDTAGGATQATDSFAGIAETTGFRVYVWRRTATVGSWFMGRRKEPGTNTGTAAGTMAFDLIGRGAASYLPGAIAELIVYNTSLTDADISRLFTDYFFPRYLLLPIIEASDSFSDAVVGPLGGQTTLSGQNPGVAKKTWVARAAYAKQPFIETWTAGVHNDQVSGLAGPIGTWLGRSL